MGIYKYPNSLCGLTFGLAFVLFILPITGAWSEKSMSISGYLICFGVACWPLVTGIYLSVYSVSITSEKIVVKALSSKEYLLVQIERVEYVIGRGGTPIAYLKISNDKNIKLWGYLHNFEKLIEILKKQLASGIFIEPPFSSPK